MNSDHLMAYNNSEHLVGDRDDTRALPLVFVSTIQIHSINTNAPNSKS